MIALVFATIVAMAPPQAARPLVFSQLSLADAQQRALEASPDVAGARARVAQSRSALALARAGFAPSFVSNYAQVPQGNPPGPTIISRQLTTSIVFTIGDLVSLGPAVRGAALTLAASEADARAAQATERIRVANLYFEALKQRSIAQARRGVLEAATAQQRAADIRVRAGDAPRLDLVRSQVAVARAAADVELATAVDLNATDALRIATQTGDLFEQTRPSDFASPDNALADPATALRLAQRRPEIASARTLAAAARAGVAGARAAGFPIVTVGAGYLVGTDSDVPIHAPTLNAQITLPFSSAAHERVATAIARAAETQTRALAIERQIEVDVTSSARTFGAAERAAKATARAREAAAIEVAATELGYRNGASSSLEVSAARSTYVQALVDEVSALYDLEKARAVLNIEVGSQP